MRYATKVILMSSGERLPVLLDNGMPVFEANLYALSEIRGRNRASSTIIQALHAVSVLYLFLNEHRIEIVKRLDEGILLAPHEIEALAVYCRRAKAQMIKPTKHVPEKKSHSKIFSLEKARLRLPLHDDFEMVSSAFALTRMQYIRNYLLWLISNRIARHGVSLECRRRLQAERDNFDKVIKARLPSGGGRKGEITGREGLDPKEQQQLLETVTAGENSPWLDEHVRVRNELIIRWLLYTGTRRGEALNLCIRDISFQKGEAMITRNADAPGDPRKNQPLSKTEARLIPISDGLLAMIQKYITDFRSKLPLARKHNYLFVAMDGSPLSLSSYTKIFVTLRKKNLLISQTLCGHILRHSWNENFSDLCDELGINDDEEMRWRERLQGWKPGSGSAAYYCKRKISRQAKRRI